MNLSSAQRNKKIQREGNIARNADVLRLSSPPRTSALRPPSGKTADGPEAPTAGNVPHPSVNGILNSAQSSVSLRAEHDNKGAIYSMYQTSGQRLLKSILEHSGGNKAAVSRAHTPTDGNFRIGTHNTHTRNGITPKERSALTIPDSGSVQEANTLSLSDDRAEANTPSLSDDTVVDPVERVRRPPRRRSSSNPVVFLRTTDGHTSRLSSDNQYNTISILSEGRSEHSTFQTHEMRKKASLHTLRTASRKIQERRKSRELQGETHIVNPQSTTNRSLDSTMCKKMPVSRSTSDESHSNLFGIFSWRGSEKSEDEKRKEIAQDLLDGDIRDTASTISFVDNIQSQIEAVSIQDAVTLGWWPPALLRFLEINRTLYSSMDRDISTPYRTAFDEPIRRAINVLKLVSNPDDYLTAFLSSDQVVKDGYWRCVLLEDNCYMYDFKHRDRSPAEKKHFALRKSISMGVRSGIFPDPLPLKLFEAMNLLKNSHAILDNFIRNQLLAVIKDTDIPEVSIKDIVQGLRDDIDRERRSITNTLKEGGEKDVDATKDSYEEKIDESKLYILEETNQNPYKSESSEIEDTAGQWTSVLCKLVVDHLRLTSDIYSFVCWQILEFENTVSAKDPTMCWYGKSMEDEIKGWKITDYERRRKIYTMYIEKVSVNRQLGLIFNSMSSTASLEQTKSLLSSREQVEKNIKSLVTRDSIKM